MEKIASNVKKINIEMPKENYKMFSFCVKRNGEKIQLDEVDSVAMTVRKIDSDNDSYEFKKTLEDGIKFNPETGNYEIEINRDDTKDMAVGQSYGYDITVFYSGTKPIQKVIGNFKIGKQYSKFSILAVEGE